MIQIRVVLPAHLRNLAGVNGDVVVAMADDVDGDGATPHGLTVEAVLDALEARYPMLRGTIRDHATHKRRPFVRYFACERDLSHDPPDTRLPVEVLDGREPFLIVGAMAGG